VPSVGAFVVGVALLVAFVRVEQRAEEPVLPLWVFSRRLLRASALVGVGVGIILIGLTSYVPTFLEAMLGVSPLTSGLTLATLTIGWPIAASQSGRLYLRLGFRATMLIGSVVVVLGTAGLALASMHPSVWAVGLACFVSGIGLGLVASPSLIAAQSSVGWGDRAVVTGANLFARSMGSAVGVAALGALINTLMRGATPAQDPAQFGDAVTLAFGAVALVALGTVAAAAAMPRTTIEHGSVSEPTRAGPD
jgi:MFS family permease